MQWLFDFYSTANRLRYDHSTTYEEEYLFRQSNYNTNIISKHRGGFPEGQTPVVLDTLSSAEYNVKY